MPPRNRQRPAGASMLTPQPEATLVSDPATVSRPAAPAPESAEVEMRFLSGRVPKELRDRFQHQAIREDRPVVALLQDAVRLYLDQHTT